MRPFAEVDAVDGRVGRRGGHLVELCDGDVGEGLVGIDLSQHGVEHERLAGGELLLLGIEVEHGIHHVAVGIDSGEVAVDGRHPEAHRTHELVGRDDILSGLVLGGLDPQLAYAGVVVGSQSLDIGIVAVEAHLHPERELSGIVIGLLAVGVEDIGVGGQILGNDDSRGYIVGGVDLYAVELGVAGDGHHHLLGLTRPYITLEGTCVGAVAGIPLAIVEHYLLDDLA